MSLHTLCEILDQALEQAPNDKPAKLDHFENWMSAICDHLIVKNERWPTDWQIEHSYSSPLDVNKNKQFKELSHAKLGKQELLALGSLFNLHLNMIAMMP